MSQLGGQAARRRLAQLSAEGERLSDRIEIVLDGSNIWVAVLALGLSGNMVAATEAVSIDQNAKECLYARELVKQLLISAPEEIKDPLCLARVFSNCLSHVAADVVYSPTGSRTSLAERKRRFEID